MSLILLDVRLYVNLPKSSLRFHSFHWQHQESICTAHISGREKIDCIAVLCIGNRLNKVKWPLHFSILYRWGGIQLQKLIVWYIRHHSSHAVCTVIIVLQKVIYTCRYASGHLIYTLHSSSIAITELRIKHSLAYGKPLLLISIIPNQTQKFLYLFVYLTLFHCFFFVCLIVSINLCFAVTWFSTRSSA